MKKGKTKRYSINYKKVYSDNNNSNYSQSITKLHEHFKTAPVYKTQKEVI